MQWLHRYAQGLMASQGDRRAGIRQKTLDQTASTGRQSDHLGAWVGTGGWGAHRGWTRSEAMLIANAALILPADRPARRWPEQDW